VDYDVLVVGSGFGGSVAALRLTEKGYRVGVLEAGRRFAADDFARTNWNLRRYLFLPRLGLRGIQRLTLLDDLLVLSGAGVGGGSLVYANTLYEPLEPYDEDLAPHYETVRRMLGATETPFETAAEDVVRAVAERMGAAHTFRPTTVAVDFDACVRCGGCMVGCRYGAKNTLDRNYLRFAEEGGAVVHPEREATLLRRVRGGWEIDTVHPGAWLRKRRTTFRAREVVLAAGVLGTLRLLLESGVGGPHVGDLVRSNSEVIVGAGVKRPTTDYSQGIAIGSSFEPTPGTRIEPVRYPKGSNLMGLFSTVLVDGGGTVPRPLRWLGELVRHPVNALLSAIPYRWAERTVILLVMQRRDSSLRVVLKRGRLRTTGASTPTWIPEGNEAARHAADVMDGLPGSGLNEVLLNRPFTAHILGGAPVSETPATGVLDRWHRVWTEPGLHVVDGSAVSANLGVNPSLTIAAQAERAMSFWPGMGEPDPRPPLGAVDLPQRVS